MTERASSVPTAKAEFLDAGRIVDQRWSDLAKDAWRRGEAATDPIEARRWLERARCIAPGDDTVLLSLALACLRGGDAAQAVALFASLTARRDLAEAWLGQAASALRSGDPAMAVAAMQAALSRHASFATARSLASSVAHAAGLPGWCALDGDGRLHADAPADLDIDGRRIAARWTDGCCRLPACRTISASRAGAPLLGSPIDRHLIGEVEGLVFAAEGGIAGWAWHPRDPERDPVLTIGGRRVTASRLLDDAGLDRPLARPRSFYVAAGGLPRGLVSVTLMEGRPLPGSPIDPGLALRCAAGLPPTLTPARAGMIGRARQVVPARQPVDVVIPVHGGSAATLACLRTVLPTLAPGGRLHVVDDAGPDPALAAALDHMAAEGRILLHRLPINRGFPGAANVGLRAAAGHDVVLLNSDTLVPPGWLKALAHAAYSAPDIGSACPFSNDATILSYPDRAGGNPMADPVPLAALARRANGVATVDIPVGVGFCMFIRHDCLAATGLLREDAFAQGYGEETDWSLRASHRGWRHVAVPGCFVAHQTGASFGSARHPLRTRNATILNQLHPGYDASIAAWTGRDPLGPARRRMDALRWRTGRRHAAVVLVTHGGGGGVDRVVTERAAALQGAGLRPVVLRPDRGATVVGGDMPNLRFHLPAEWAGLLRLLRQDRVERVELHHMLGHTSELLTLAGRLGVRLDVFVHDYASFCARIKLVPDHRHCGEPPIARCDACIAEHGSALDEAIAPAALVARSAAMFAAAARVVVPSTDAATRIRRHFPTVDPAIEPPEDDASTLPPPPTSRPVRHLCIVGAIGIEKGYGVLLDCVRDAAQRQLPLRYTVVGFTVDDARLLTAGPVFITGPYEAGTAEPLIRAQDADLAFIPSIWPETWCFTLGEVWRAGLRAAVFDLGAPAERVRRTGWGHVLPVGASAAAINDWTLGLGTIRHPTRTGRPRAALAPSPSPRNPAK